MVEVLTVTISLPRYNISAVSVIGFFMPFKMMKKCTACSCCFLFAIVFLRPVILLRSEVVEAIEQSAIHVNRPVLTY